MKKDGFLKYRGKGQVRIKVSKTETMKCVLCSKTHGNKFLANAARKFVVRKKPGKLVKRPKDLKKVKLRELRQRAAQKRRQQIRILRAAQQTRALKLRKRVTNWGHFTRNSKNEERGLTSALLAVRQAKSVGADPEI